MARPDTCPVCGASLPGDAPQGYCPRCLAGLAAGVAPNLIETSAVHGTIGGEETIHYFGDYELTGEIASGGMGVVYRARQISLNRIVALKMIRAGQFASSAEVERFRTEAEAAANLDHPNIVPIYEVGEHKGRHYFSMKLVEGGNLAGLIASTEVRDAKWLKRSARLIGTMARAIHHAHQRGVLHRDLKPTNILLDEHGEPHLTDFGLAKLVERGKDLTQTLAVLGTPNYMSPEQAAGHAREVTTSADIYSLGAILYELITGRPPFKGDSALEVLEQARQREPESLRKLNPAVDRELETICRKCLEKEPARRYDTAEAVAGDLDHWLAGEPIQARATTPAERVVKWGRRNPAMAALIVLAHLLFVGGMGGVLWQWRRAEAEADRATKHASEAAANAAQARLETAKAKAISDFLQQMLGSANPVNAKGSTYTVRQLLDDYSDGLGKQFTDQPEVEAEIRATIGKAYRQLGAGEKSELHLKRALELRRSIHGDVHEAVALALIDYAWSLIELSKADGNRLAEAENCARQALSIYRRTGADAGRVIPGLWTLQRIVNARGRSDDVETIAQEALAVASTTPGIEYPELANITHLLAESRIAQGRLVQAELAAKDAIVLHRRLQGDKHPETAWALHALGRTLDWQGKFAEAEIPLRESLDIFHWNYGVEHHSVVSTLGQLNSVLIHQGKGREAEAITREELNRQNKLLGEEHPLVAATLHLLAIALDANGNGDEAEQMLRKSLAMVKGLSGDKHPEVAQTRIDLSMLLLTHGKSDEARPVYHEFIESASAGNLNELAHLLATAPEAGVRDGETAVRIAEKIVADTGHKNAIYLDTLASAYAETGRFLEAIRVQQQAIACLEPGDLRKESYLFRLKLFESNQPFRAFQTAAGKLRKQGRLAEAATFFRQELAARRKAVGDEDSYVASSLAELVSTLLEAGSYAEAEPLARECLATREKVMPDDWLTFNAKGMLGGSLLGQFRYAEAEPLLLSSYEGMKQRQEKIPAVGRIRLKEALQRLVQLYEVKGEQGKVDEFKQRLLEFEQLRSK